MPTKSIPTKSTPVKPAAIKSVPFVIAYDFDGTLAPGNMQEHDFIPDLDLKPEDFWKEVKAIAKKQQADEILAYMQLMLQKAKTAQVSLHKADFVNFGAKISFFPGVVEWFDRINAYGRDRQVDVRHFIISSGLREMIEGTSIKNHFERIYASGFMYDKNDVPCWPALAVNYTTKTQFLFRINKGSPDVHDHSVINKYVEHPERDVPFTNMVFIGDGETDIPSMRLVKNQGGHSIAVYRKDQAQSRKMAMQLVDEGRANLAVLADYSENTTVDCAVKAMIDKIAANHKIAKAGQEIKNQ